MTREERAKQFMPFDAMKGLKEALAKKEEQRTRVEKRELSEDAIEEISKILQRAAVGMEAEIIHYRASHEVVSKGNITAIDITFKFLRLNAEKIYFDNIYDIKISEL